MKFFVVSACLLVGASAVIHQEVIQAKWSSFKAQHGKEYAASEETARLNNYLETTLLIEKHNERFHRGEVSYELGHNSLSDLTPEEVKTRYLGRRSMSLEGFNITDAPPMAGVGIPPSVDWRDKGIVTPARDQDHCGSCYAFGTMGVIESAVAQATGKLMDLSEQQVIDCSYHIQGDNNGGCEGGFEVIVMQYASQFGLATEGEYIYQSGRSGTHYSCKRPTGGSYGKGMKFRRVQPYDEVALATAVANYGTMVVVISGENREFQLFHGNGIFENPLCPQQVNHVVSIVGYGSEGGKDYWIVKNSWGNRWGVNGFGKVRRGVNQCGLVSDYSWSLYFE